MPVNLRNKGLKRAGDRAKAWCLLIDTRGSVILRVQKVLDDVASNI
jgi:hypothetical protein